MRLIRYFLLFVVLALTVVTAAYATVGTATNSVTAQGNGVTITWSYNFKIPTASEAVVIYTDASGNQTTLPPSSYTLTGAGSSSGGSVVYPTVASGNPPIANGTTLTIERVVPYVQTTSVANQGPTFAAIENGLDNTVYQTQQLATQGTRSIQIPASDTTGLNVTLPTAANRASQFACFDSSGNVQVCPGTGVIGGPAGRDLSGSYPNPTVAKVDGVAYPASPSTNTVPVVTGSNTVTYEKLPNSALATMAGSTIKGNNSGSSAAPSDLTVAQTQALLVQIVRPGGRLTLVTATPVMTSDQTAKGTIYYTPYQTNVVPIYNGTSSVMTAFSEISVTLDSTNAVSGSIYDLFVYNDSGTIRLGYGPAWTNTTTRSAAISMTNGIWANTSTITLRYDSTHTTSVSGSQATYVGSFYATANGQTGMAFAPSAASGGSNNILGLV
jgi:hypothetical protein